MKDASGARAPGSRTLLLLVLAGLALAILISLGTWQVRRLQWKEALIATIEERIRAEPVPLDEILDLHREGGEIEYRPVRMSGRFLHDAEQYFLATHQGVTGWHVYVPLQLASGEILFVNRGFVPYDRRDPTTRPEGQVEGIVSLAGLARTAPEEKPSSLVPDNDPEKRIYYWKDLEAMRRATNLPDVLPVFVDVDDAPNRGGLPIGGVTMIQLPNNHLQYAVTWYGLALALLGVTGFWLHGQWRGRP